jgi:hypothetical protein
MQTTTTAAPEGGSHYLLSHICRPCGLTYCLTISFNDGCMAFGIVTANASAHESAYDTAMPGVTHGSLIVTSCWLWHVFMALHYLS